MFKSEAFRWRQQSMKPNAGGAPEPPRDSVQVAARAAGLALRRLGVWSAPPPLPGDVGFLTCVPGAAGPRWTPLPPPRGTSRAREQDLGCYATYIEASSQLWPQNRSGGAFTHLLDPPPSIMPFKGCVILTIPCHVFMTCNMVY